jgi:hypothetical protein
MKLLLGQYQYGVKVYMAYVCSDITVISLQDRHGRFIEQFVTDANVASRCTF